MAGKSNELMIAVDGGKWYSKKVQEVLSRVRKEDIAVSIPVLPLTGWKKFPSGKIPNSFCYGTIYEHIIASCKLKGVDGNPDITTDVNTTKPMKKGREFYLSGHVKNIKDCWINNHYFVKSVVQASYSEENRNVTLTMRGDDAFVLDASCDCKSSEMGRCNHVAALLFAIEDFTLQFGYETPACTSVLCTWNVGRKKHRDPKPAHEQMYTKKAAPDRIINFDPRPQDERTETSEDQFATEFIKNLPLSGPSTVFSHLLEIKYDDYDVDIDSLKECVISAEEDMKCGVMKSAYEVPGTRDQADSPEWFQARAFRVTASVAKDVLGLSSRHSQYKFLRKHLWGFERLQVKSMLYGKQNENNAFQQYLAENSHGEKVEKTGFWVNPKYPQLGGSPDGLISCNSKVNGVLEIKCPAVLEKIIPANIHELSEKQRRNLCFSIVNGVPRLKRTHKYYYQIQIQMVVCNVSFCDFVIWSPKGMSVERILKDTEFCQSVLPRLQRFHRNVMLPEYLEMRVPRKLLPVTL